MCPPLPVEDSVLLKSVPVIQVEGIINKAPLQQNIKERITAKGTIRLRNENMLQQQGHYYKIGVLMDRRCGKQGERDNPNKQL